MGGHQWVRVGTTSVTALGGHPTANQLPVGWAELPQYTLDSPCSVVFCNSQAVGPSQEDTARLAGCAWAKPRKQIPFYVPKIFWGLFISMVFFLKSLMSLT